MFSLIAYIVSFVWIQQHLAIVLIVVAAIILLIGIWIHNNKKRRAAYLALPVQFIGNKATKKYHAAGCPQLSQIHPENRVAFRLPAETARLGYTPCGICHPRWPED